ncbi:uncharacterized protein YbjT (DUF2867 family) [Psychromicrobium silvestre]|uniref:Uncharacterized protein YbjT (DUF2867 family) n=1 Tax=Psychromicrobium silvestre TaxID=1645614 RepID=A0A7Y9S897_9MICC|nr:SDR family oxidoreductase [Psychromicrobium silvestre]NYE95751.1 uncharacterized protein YbjT (DUF2867 family) [Psychromicrobium silvestre]
MSTELAVTGATGHIGGLVATLLSEAGASQRLLLRNPQGVNQLPGASVHRFSGYTDAEAAHKALTGVETLFMVSAAEAPDRLEQHFTFINAAAEAGVQRIVYTSFLGASPEATFTLARDHWATEQHILGKGLEYTFLRDNFYLDVLSVFADQQGVIRGPAGEGKVAGVARADVARVAAKILLQPAEHLNTVYDLTGPEALSFAEISTIIGEATGRETSFQNETVEEAYASRAVFNAERWELDAWVSTYTAIATGELAEVTNTVREITGQAPTSLRDLLRTAS